MNELENGDSGEKDLMDQLMDETPRKGGLVQYDDLENGQLICVHSIKGSNDAATIMGQAIMVNAVCFPFFTATIYGSGEPLILDVRFLNLMKVTQEFADSQKRVALKPKRGPQE
jgi:hypothetical protein